MKYPWIDACLLAKPAVTKDLQPEWNWVRYQIGGKMFAAILLDGEDRPYYINVKLEPAQGETLRAEYPDIIPGYYSNKQHWNSVRADGEVPDELLRSLLDTAYHLVLTGFGKQRQREILGLSACGTDCSACPDLPCAVWRATRDPSLSDEEFQKSIGGRVGRLAAL